MSRWLRVWLQGGPADDRHYETLVEPSERLRFLADPRNPQMWLRLPDDARPGG
jgi:hypothetical protein